MTNPRPSGRPGRPVRARPAPPLRRAKSQQSTLVLGLARSGHGRNEKLWTVAQAVSEVLPDRDKEKQLLQGLLNQRDKVEEAMAEERLF